MILDSISPKIAMPYDTRNMPKRVRHEHARRYMLNDRRMADDAPSYA